MLQTLVTSTVVAGALASQLWCGVDAWLAARGRRVSPAAIAAVLAAVTVAAWLRWGVAPARHAMYVDEPWYAEAACRFIDTGSLEICSERWSGPACEPFGKAPGWPVLLGAWMRIRGCDTAAGIQLNRVIGTASVALVALLAVAAGATGGQAAVAASLLALHPVHVAWSATGETNVAAAFAIAAALCGALWYAGASRRSAASLAITGFAVATAIRPELVVVALIAAICLALSPSRRRVALSVVALAAVAATTASPLWSMNESISRGGFLSLGNLVANTLALSVLDWGVLALASGGVAAMVGRGRGGAALMLTASGLAAGAVVLAYDRFASRMLLTGLVALLPLCGGATGLAPARWRGLVAVALIGVAGFACAAELGDAAAPPETQLLELRAAQRVGAWSRANGHPLIITEEPTVLVAAGARRVMGSREAIAGEDWLRAVVERGEGVYFFSDMYCEQGYAGGDSAVRCGRVLELFEVSAAVEERLHSRSYGLHRLEAPR